MNKPRGSALAAVVFSVVVLALAPAPVHGLTVPIVLNNPSFDASGEEVGATGFSTSIGWSDANPSSPSGGVYNNKTPESAPNAAYTAPGTFNGGYQLGNYALQPGDLITLTYYAQNSYQSPKASVHLIETTLPWTGGGTGSAQQISPYSATAVIATSQPTTTASWAQYTLTYTAVAADAGKIAGVEFDNAGGGYTNYDNFAMTVSHTFVHPGISHTMTDLNRFKNNTTVQPYAAAYAAYASSGYSQSTNTGQGPFTYETYGHGQFEIRNDAAVCHQNAVMWYITGNTAYLNNAITIMMGWANTLTAFDVTDYLTAGTAIKDFCNAGEIIRATGNGAWTPAQITQFQNWMMTYLYPALIGSGNIPQVGSVLQAAGAGGLQMNGLLALGIFCDRPDIYSFGVTSYQHNNHYTYGLLEYINPNGQNYETQRDTGHASGNLGTFAASAYMVLNQGQDLFGLSNNLLAKAFESQAKFDLGYDVPPIAWTAVDGSFHCKMSGDNRQPQDGLQSDLAYYIYHEIKGLNLPYTQMSADYKFPNCTSDGSLYYLVDNSGQARIASQIGQPAATTVSVFEDYLSGTYFPYLAPGSYNAAALSAAGVWQYGSGGVSSMRVPIGWTVTAYSGDNYTGSTFTFTGTLANQGIVNIDLVDPSFNDALTSMVITAGNQPYPIFNGTYQLVSQNSGKVAEIPGSSTANGTALDQNTNAGGFNQLWSIQSIGHGQYSIQNLNSNLAMEVSGSSLSQGALLDQWTYTPEANLATGGTASASADNAGSGEGAAQAFDENINTKWYDPVTGGTGWLQYQLASAASVDTYVITSAGDVQQRDPAAWQFQGSNNGTTWTTLDTQTGQIFANRSQAQSYSLTNTTAYLYYRLNITANNGGSAYGLQIAELGLYSSKSGAVNQRWTFSPVSGSALGSYFTIINANSSLLMDESGGSQSNGAAILQWPGNNGLNQRWSLQVPPLLLP
jgi:hypothetical protein